MTVGFVAYVDPEQLDANVAAFHGRAAAVDVAVRAHVKGHRTVEIARRQVAAGACGLAVHYATEARRYADAGVRDITIAHPWEDPWRWELFAGLAGRCELTLHAASLPAVAGIGAAAARRSVPIGIRLDLSAGSDGRRPKPSRALALGRAVAAEPWLRLRGVTGYRGLATATDAAARHSLGEANAVGLVAAAELLRGEGLPCDVVCAGGTPTAEGALRVPGVTEICAGAYALNDAGLATIGVCRLDEVAISVPGPAEAKELVGEHNYPWCAHEEAAYRIGDRWLPMHVCPVVQRVDALRPSAGGPDDWPTLARADREGASA